MFVICFVMGRFSVRKELSVEMEIIVRKKKYILFKYIIFIGKVNKDDKMYE